MIDREFWGSILMLWIFLLVVVVPIIAGIYLFVRYLESKEDR